MTDLRKHLDALHEAATPGKWGFESGENGPDDWDDMPDVLIGGTGIHDGIGGPDAKWIAESYNAWPEVSKQLAALEAQKQAVLGVLAKHIEGSKGNALWDDVKSALDVTP